MTQEKYDIPRIGLCIFIIKDGKLLFGKRKSAHGEGTWAPPGGKLDYNETIEECAMRETFEETGVRITNIRKGPYTEDFFESGKHFITLYIVADWLSGEPYCAEPDKCERWEWVDWNDLPQPLFLTIENVMKLGFNPLHLRP